jgi:hypothetical protein
VLTEVVLEIKFSVEAAFQSTGDELLKAKIDIVGGCSIFSGPPLFSCSSLITHHGSIDLQLS